MAVPEPEPPPSSAAVPPPPPPPLLFLAKTALRSTAVLQAVAGRFLAASSYDVVFGKYAGRDMLAVLSDSGKLSILAFDPDLNRFVALRHVALSDRPRPLQSFAPRELGWLLAVHPLGRAVAVAAMEGRVAVLPVLHSHTCDRLIAKVGGARQGTQSRPFVRSCILEGVFFASCRLVTPPCLSCLTLQLISCAPNPPTHPSPPLQCPFFVPLSPSRSLTTPAPPPHPPLPPIIPPLQPIVFPSSASSSSLPASPATIPAAAPRSTHTHNHTPPRSTSPLSHLLCNQPPTITLGTIWSIAFVSSAPLRTASNRPAPAATAAASGGAGDTASIPVAPSAAAAAAASAVAAAIASTAQGTTPPAVSPAFHAPTSLPSAPPLPLLYLPPPANVLMSPCASAMHAAAAAAAAGDAPSPALLPAHGTYQQHQPQQHQRQQQQVVVGGKEGFGPLYLAVLSHRYVVCKCWEKWTLGSVLCALCSVLSALCSMLSALCSVLSALCSLLSALCSLLPALCSLCALRSALALRISEFAHQATSMRILTLQP
ncbi:unnamed protein product [Closterium sp. NIES-53]